MQNSQLIRVSGCPDSHSPPMHEGNVLKSQRGKEYPIIDGIPCISTTPIQRHFDLEISVLILALNEEESIQILIRDVTSELRRAGESFEIVIVDGGSTDRTVELSRTAGARVITQERPGYSEALILGLKNTQGKYLITLDGDLSHPASFIPELLKNRHAAEVVIGSRWITGGSFEGALYRKVFSVVLNNIFKRVLSLPINDISSGFRLYQSRILSPDLYKSKDFSVLEEILVRAYVEGFSIKEVALNFKNRHGGASHVRFFKFALSFVKTLWRMWLLRWPFPRIRTIPE